MTTAKHVPPADAFVEQFEHEIREFFRDLAATVVKGELFLSGRIKVQHLHRLVRLAVYDRWYDYGDDEIREMLAGKGDEVSEHDLHFWRTSPEMQEVQSELDGAFQKIAVPKRLKEHLGSEEAEHEAYWRTLRLARQTGELKVAERALDQINERILPTRRRDEDTGQGRGVFVRMDNFNLIQAGNEILKRAGIESPDLPDVIDVKEEDDAGSSEEG